MKIFFERGGAFAFTGKNAMRSVEKDFNGTNTAGAIYKACKEENAN